MFKNYILAVCILLAGGSSFSQITITSADMPNAGDSIKVSVTNSIGSEDETLTGPNYTWDYSSLVPNNQRYEKFDSPFTFTSPYNWIFNAGNTSYGKDNYQNTGSPVPGFSIDKAYDFFKETSTSFQQIGAAYTINGTPIPFMYQKKDTLYRFPMNYLNVDSCDYKFGLNVPTFGYYGQKGHRVNEVDGWGTITTPVGSFAVLRWKSTIMAVDTVNYSGFGFNVPRPVRHEYKWIAAGNKIPILYVNETAGNVIEVVYMDTTRAGVPQVGIHEASANAANLSVFPNPASDRINVQYELSTTSSMKISIVNTLGQTMSVIANGNAVAGKHNLEVDLKPLNLVPGIYGVCFDSNNAREVKSIIVTR